MNVPSPARPTVLVVEFLPSGGMFQFAHQLAEGLARSGCDVELLTGPAPELRSTEPGLRTLADLPTWHPNDRTPAAFPVSLLPVPAQHLLRRGARAARLAESWRRVLVHVRRTRPDVVQFGELRFALDRWGLRAVARAGRTRVVDVAHNPLPFDVSGASTTVEKAGRASRRSLGRAYRACSVILVLGEGPLRDLVRAFPDAPVPVVIGHGEYSSFRGPEVGGVRDSDPHLLFFGTWTRYKNLPLLLEAFALVRATHPDARLTIAGNVMDDVDADALAERAEAVGGVTLAPGYVAVEDVPALFGSCRAVVTPYSVVNISGVVHLAYTFGRPVVATDVGSMSDVVHHGVTGLLADPTPSAIAAALRVVLDDPGTAARLGDAGRELVEREFSWDTVAARALSAMTRPDGGQAPVAPVLAPTS